MRSASPFDRFRRPRSALRLLVLSGIGLMLAGCAQVSGDADHITIQHLAFQPLFADREAQHHCEKFGKKAVKTRVGPIQPGFLAVQTRVSEYECVEPN